MQKWCEDLGYGHIPIFSVNILIFFFILVYLPQVWLGCPSKPWPPWEDGRCGCAPESTLVPAATTQRAARRPGCICPSTEWGCWCWFRDILYRVSWQAVLKVAWRSAPGKEMEGRLPQAHKVIQRVRAQGKNQSNSFEMERFRFGLNAREGKRRIFWSN